MLPLGFARGKRDEPARVAEPDTGPTSPIKIALFTLLLAGEVFAFSVFQAPRQTLVRFAAMDSGGELAIQDLIGRGFRPGVDFGYPYGLLSLLVGRVWYGFAGLSPRSFNGYVLTCSIFSAWGLARFAVYRRSSLVGLALIALAIPDLGFVTLLTSVHAIEQALLIHALAEQARGRRGTALALLTACCFVKPSLAFAQGLVVLIAVVAAGFRAGRSAMVRPIVASIVTAGLVALVLSASFGPSSMMKTLSPTTGAAIYRTGHYGFFFGEGRKFWDLPGAGFRDYFRYELGFWALGTVFLLVGGILAARRLVRGVESSEQVRNDEMIVTCSTVHLAFFTLLFGHRFTWVYSLPMLILGLVSLANLGPRHRLAVWVLAALLLVNDRSKLGAIRQLRQTESAGAVTLGLWAGPSERDEWAHALDLTRGRRPALFGMCEGGALLFPGFAPPTSGYLIPGNMLPVEVERKAKQLAEAGMIVSFYPPDWEGFELWPQLKAGFDGCELIRNGQFLRVYRRSPSVEGRSVNLEEGTRPARSGSRGRGRWWR